jgi:hypothetical protein
MFKQINLAQTGGRKKHTFFILAQMDYTQNELIFFVANELLPIYNIVSINHHEPPARCATAH